MTLKERTKLISDFIIGSEASLEPDHRFLNLIIFLTFFAQFMSIPTNTFMNLNPSIAIINSFGLLFTGGLFYLSRVRQMKIFPAVTIIFLIFGILNIDWFFNGGMGSGIVLYLISLFVVSVFLLNGFFRTLFSVLLFVDIIGLIVTEYFHPDWVTPFPTRLDAAIDYILCFVLTIPIILSTVYFSKKMYLKEKQNTISLIDQYRKNGEFLRKQVNDQILALSAREQKVFHQIIEGKSNKEIADLLNVELVTVKTHINNIYKKLDVKSRSEISKYKNLKTSSEESEKL